LEEIERDVIIQTLERTSGNVKKSAEILRVHRPTFYRKLKKFGIKVERESESPGSGHAIVIETPKNRNRFKVKQIAS
jgi:hypothetical protein